MLEQCLFLVETKDTNGAITVAANPGLQCIIVFKYIYSNRVALAGKRGQFLKIIIIDLEYVNKITAVAGYKQEFMIF